MVENKRLVYFTVRSGRVQLLGPRIIIESNKGKEMIIEEEGYDLAKNESPPPDLAAVVKVIEKQVVVHFNGEGEYDEATGLVDFMLTPAD